MQTIRRALTIAMIVLVAAALSVSAARAAEPKQRPAPGAAAPRPHKVSISERLAQLDHWNPQVRQIGAEALAAYGDDARRIALPALINALHDVDPGVRRAVVQTLAALSPPWWATSEGWIYALGDIDPLVQRAAVDGIAAQGVTAVPELTAALESSTVRRRQGAALALGSIGPAAEPARLALEKLRGDPNHDVETAAEWALTALGPPPAPIQPPAPEPVQPPPAPASAPGGTWLVLPVPTGWVAAAAGGAGMTLAIAALVARARRRAAHGHTGSHATVGTAGDGAGDLGFAEARRSIEKALDRLHGPEGERRFAGVQALAEHGARAVPGLIQALHDEDPELRYWAVAALEQMGAQGAAAVSPLADLIASPAERDDTRTFAAHALSRMGSRAIGNALLLLRAEQVATRRHAASVFQRLGHEGETAAAQLVPSLGDSDAEVVRTVEDALGSMSESVAPRLATALGHELPQVRLSAARILGRLGARDDDVRNALAAACGDVDPEVQQQAAATLAALADPIAPLVDEHDPDGEPGNDGSPPSPSGLVN